MAKAPPSQFSALLRRSKFSSYDPSITQVYTAYDGYAHRGDFGFKRPLPLRRRNAHVTVREMDSRQQQTVWRSAEAQDRWIRMWQEIGVTPLMRTSGYWAQKLGPSAEWAWFVDSEFVRREGTSSTAAGAQDTPASPSVSDSSQAYPNIHAMSEKEFEQYLANLRKLRPAFKEFIEKRAAENAEQRAVTKNVPEVVPNLWYQSQHPRQLHMQFIEQQAAAKYNSNTSTEIEQMPQKLAGLTYTRSPILQSRLIQKPHKGRILHEVNARDGNSYAVGFAGNVVLMNKKAITYSKTTPWKSLLEGTEQEEARGEKEETDAGTSVPKDGVVNFRVYNAALVSPPRTAGVSSGGMERTNMRLGVIPEETNVEDYRPNPYPPGTPAYVGHTEGVTTPSFVMSKFTLESQTPEAYPKVENTALIGQLQSMVRMLPPQPE